MNLTLFPGRPLCPVIPGCPGGPWGEKGGKRAGHGRAGFQMSSSVIQKSEGLSVLPWQPADLPLAPSLHWSLSAQKDLVHPGKSLHYLVVCFGIHCLHGCTHIQTYCMNLSDIGFFQYRNFMTWRWMQHSICNTENTKDQLITKDLCFTKHHKEVCWNRW